MKLLEVGVPFDEQAHARQVEWLDKHVGDLKWKWGDNGVVNVSEDFTANERLGSLPVQFGHISGDFNVMACALTSFKGFPMEAFNINADSNDIGSFEGLMVRDCNSFTAHCRPLTSLKGIHKHIKKCFWLEFGEIHDSVLGLMFVKGLDTVMFKPSNVCAIVSDHIKRKADVHELQEALMAAGPEFEPYARM